jgi:hypothetical protein
MAVDLFNNTSNDYVYPELSPCAGESDSAAFEFLPGQSVGIISGSDILSSMGLGDLSQPVTGWDQQTKLVQPGEVTFIPGLTKGISQQKQVFLFDTSVCTGTNSMTMSVDLSLNHYRSFRHYDSALHAQANSVDGVDIANALNIQFQNQGILITATYDTSGLIFTSNTAGYQIDITNVYATCTNNPSVGYLMIYDTSTSIPAFKYPNTAMLGYVLRVIYPSTAADYESYVEITHVPEILTYFEPSTGNTECWVKYTKSIDIGLAGKTSNYPNVMSANEYLAYIEENNKWEKVGLIRIWLAAVDPANSAIKNLIPGFYVYNPHTFAVQITYMTIV